MNRLVKYAAIATIVFFAMTNRLSLSMLDPRPVGSEVSQFEVVRRVDDLEARFTKTRRYEESMMLSGGKALALRNEIPHAVLSGLPLNEARRLVVGDPDLLRGGRPWSERAMEDVQTTAFIASDRRTRAVLEDALSDAQRASRSGGARPCLTVRGSALMLDAIESFDGKDGIGDESRRANGGRRFVLAEEARLEPCDALLGIRAD